MKRIANYIFQKLKKLHSEYFSLILIPDAGKNIFEFKFKKLYLYCMIPCLIAASAYSLYMTHLNASLAQNLTVKANTLNYLQSTSSIQKKQIEEYKAELAAISKEIESINTVENEIKSIMGLKSASAAASVSRSAGKRTAYSSDSAINSAIQADQEAEYLNEVLDAKIKEMNDLVDDVQSKLQYLAAIPDNYPAKGKLTSLFGYRYHPIYHRTMFHEGIDIANKSGTGIYAAGKGKVTFVGYKSGYGKTVIVSHGYGFETLYAHTREILVSEGDSVEKGQLIAEMGSTGSSTGTHLHFEVHKNGELIDPLDILN